MCFYICRTESAVASTFACVRACILIANPASQSVIEMAFAFHHLDLTCDHFRFRPMAMMPLSRIALNIDFHASNSFKFC